MKQPIEQRKSELNNEIASYTQLLNNSDIALKNKLQEVSLAFDSLQSNLFEVIDNLRVLQPILIKYGDVISEKNQRLFIYGAPAEPISFNKENCFSVYEGLKQQYFSILKAVFSDWNGFCSSSTGLNILRSIAQIYNTFTVIYSSIPTMREEWSEQITSKSKAEQLAAFEKKAEIEKRLLNLQEETERREETLRKLAEKVSFSDSQRLIAANDFTKGITLPIGYCEETEEIAEWDLSKHGVLRLITKDKTIENDTIICDFIKNTVYHFFNSYSAGATRLTLYDGIGRIEFKKLLGNLSEAIVSGEDDISDKFIYTPTKSIDCCLDAFESACDLIESSRVFDIFKANTDNRDSFQPIYLFVLYGCPSTTILKEAILANIRMCRENGIFFLIVEKEEEINSSYGLRSGNLDRMANMLTFSLNGNGELRRMLGAAYDEQNALATENTLRLATLSERFIPSEYAKCFGRDIKERLKTPIPLTRLFDEYKRDERADFSKVISVPVGIEENGRIKSLTFNTGDGTSHCAIFGITGSGKSSVLQAIILGGAYYYSPEEIEFYLIDMKHGSAFYDEHNFDYSKLKHVKMVAANCSEKDLRDFVKFIVSERMSDLYKNISSYNMLHTGSDRLKRTVVVIDEYNAIKDQKCIAYLEEIARKGRSYGVSLILAANEKNSAFNTVLSNISNAVEFKSNSVGDLIGKQQNVSVKASDINFTKNLKGNCISYDGNSSNLISRFRAAFSPYQNDLIREINDRYPSVAMTPKIIIGDLKRLIDSSANAAIKTSAAPHDSGAVFASTIGKSLFNSIYNVYFGKMHTKHLLLFGDEKRAESIEYSLACAMDSGRVFYFNFAGKTDKLFYQIAEVSDESTSIKARLRELHRIYKERSTGNSEIFEPILAILHNASECGKILLEKDKTVIPKTEKAPIAAPLRSTHGSPQSGSVEMPPIDDEYEKMRSSSFRSGFIRNNDPSHSDSGARSNETSLSAKLQELLKDGFNYGICIAVHADFDGIQNDSEILGKPIGKVFNQTIVIPSLIGDDQIAKGNVNNALKLIHANEFIDTGVFSSNERIRCYHIIDNDYKQFIPYEWE